MEWDLREEADEDLVVADEDLAVADEVEWVAPAVARAAHVCVLRAAIRGHIKEAFRVRAYPVRSAAQK